MGFTNPITGQNGALVRSNIHSPGYTPGVSGWTINKDGTVEFNNGTFRGDVVLSGAGAILEYSALALNGLIVALAPSAGSDIYGNTYNPGLNLFDGAGNTTGNWGALTGFSIQDAGNVGIRMNVSVPIEIFYRSIPFNDGSPGSIVGILSDIATGRETLQINGPSATAPADPNSSSVRFKLTSGNSVDGADGRIIFTSSGADTVMAQFTHGLLQLNIGYQANDHSSVHSSNTAGSLSLFQAVNTSTNPGTLSIQDFASTSGSIAVFVAGDAHSRLVIRASGQMEWGSGAASLDTILARTAAGILGVTTGSFAVATAGQGYQCKEGSNAKMGTAVLAAGAVTVANTAVTANSRIFLTIQTPGGTPGAVFVNSRVAGTSFTIHSTSAADTSTVAYFIVEPA